MYDAGNVVAQAGIEKCLRTHNIREDEVGSPVNGAINVGLGCKVNDGVVTGQHLIEQIPITDVTGDDLQSWIGTDVSEIGSVTRVGELVVDGDLLHVHVVCTGECAAHEV